ncbi:MAG: GIY-YIG nuclease family protein [Nitrospinae bacterium]|nr:GIY-YIG nuclease family protein [Nitrospinota bacterium]
MFYVYVLHSGKDGGIYTGVSGDLNERIKYHEQGKVASTKDRRPLNLVYYEAYIMEKDAKSRELFLKSGSGKRFLKKQLRHYFDKYPWK